ncbi:exodeoxyribonuclease VII large subunit [Nitratidesulfovibrio sp. 1201_IL3209]|uniref:exodeoxyribonuclease VII large subunit n=1 Tax=Nitratidesulfovibrio sp. 1201_IL3209 TaxID=3084053 RepID=UPI002FD91A21
MSTIYTVGELTRAIRAAVEGGFPFVWVRGQVSNLSRPSSGHCYFALKDEDAVLNCVWFRGNQRDAEHFDPMTGEVFEDGPRPGLARTMANGQELLCAGRLTVYPPRGGYQLVVEMAQDAGLGRLHAQFEALKARLAERGYFDAARKRPLPRHPKRVAVVTAPTGAAIRDFLRMAEERGWGCQIRIHPVPVQGDEAPPRIEAALADVAAQGWAQVAVLIRGGGSLEDLWAFNDERVATAVFASPLPVLGGIGHEVDHTMADMTADVRAATPTHAAQLLWPERRELAQRVDELEMALTRGMERRFARLDEQLGGLMRGLAWLSPERALARLDERFADAVARLGRAWDALAQRNAARLAAADAALARVLGPEAWDRRERAVDALESRLRWAGDRAVTAREHELERCALRLDALDPLRPLERGYSLVRRADGGFLRSVAEAAPGDALAVLVRDGEVDVTVRGARAGGMEGQDGAAGDGCTVESGGNAGTGATERPAGEIS